jgi:hypothetical protein
MSMVHVTMDVMTRGARRSDRVECFWARVCVRGAHAAPLLAILALVACGAQSSTESGGDPKDAADVVNIGNCFTPPIDAGIASACNVSLPLYGDPSSCGVSVRSDGTQSAPTTLPGPEICRLLCHGVSATCEVGVGNRVGDDDLFVVDCKTANCPNAGGRTDGDAGVPSFQAASSAAFFCRRRKPPTAGNPTPDCGVASQSKRRCRRR